MGARVRRIERMQRTGEASRTEILHGRSGALSRKSREQSPPEASSSAARDATGPVKATALLSLRDGGRDSGAARRRCARGCRASVLCRVKKEVDVSDVSRDKQKRRASAS